MRCKMSGGLCGLAVLCLGLVVWSLTGCEEAENVRGIEVVPPYATLHPTGGGSNTVQFTALVSGPLALPLEWRVANPALGTIASSSGSNAVYVAHRQRGDNIIYVRDQYDAEGYATVHQD